MNEIVEGNQRSMADAVSALRGHIIHGEERIGTQEAAAALGCEHKLLKPLMRSAGWDGPRSMRLIDANGKLTIRNGYRRDPKRLEQVDDGVAAVEPLEPDLVRALLGVVRGGFKDVRAIQRLPVDENNGPLLRAKMSAASLAFTTQLRADEARMKAKTQGDALARLLKIMEKERRLLTAADVDHRGEPKDVDDATERKQGYSVIAGHASVPVSAEDADSTHLIDGIGLKSDAE